jgi:preprotein translocase subunit SecD
MVRPLKFSLLVFALLAIIGFFHPATASDKEPAAMVKQPAPTSTQKNKLADGLYLVLRSAHEPKIIEPLGAAEQLVPNDFHFLEPDEREPVVYLVLQTKPFVPLILGSDPCEDREQATGKPRLQVELAEDQKRPLEDFTRAHLGQTIAIVVGGDVVTAHKIKSVITGGRLQITRCTKHGCETLFTSLLKNHSKS